ncbi:phosphatidate cytidylyltransferase [Bradyrhizobium sp. 2TAF24]|uniref:phosphatidate cytidylyltransferase n=1 Tax=Bradyrhizobium sp. 2TAF24 TaxID=3233011 RepID=UPI003F9281DF
MPQDNAAPATATEQGARNLLMRVAAAVVLAPLTIAAAYLGGWLWAALVLIAAAGLYVEWLMIVGAAGNVAVLIAGLAALIVAGLCTMGWLMIAVVALLVGVAVVAIFGGAQRLWVCGGLAYAGLALLASDLVRFDASAGFLALMFVLLIVWVTDIGGYFAGRGIGGPKLWPRVSPKKTWAGAIGGLAGSLLIALAFAALGFGRTWPLLGLAAVLSVVSQLGDLFESAVKRTFGVKDSSHIIPGHGGLLDRLDGFVAAIVFAVLVGALRGGIDGVGRGLMVW